MNILVTSASRKVSLIRALQRALIDSGGGQVVAADISPLAPALYVADAAMLSPRSDDPEFVGAMVSACRERAIALLVPTRDEELPVFAAHVAAFAAVGTRVAVSSSEVVDICQDKVRFSEFCLEHHLPTPITYSDAANAPLPLFVKPRRGKGGLGTASVATRPELERAVTALGGDAVIQALIEAPEYTIDLFADFDGRVISIVPRQRLEIVAGESYVSRTERRPDLRDLGLAVAGVLRLVGPVTIQCFATDAGPLLIEVNPRFGGAAALGWAAGPSSPHLLVSAARGLDLKPRIDDFEDGLVMLRHTDDLFLRPGDLLRSG